MMKFSKYVELDTHKDTIPVAIAKTDHSKPRSRGDHKHSGAGREACEEIESPEGLILVFRGRPPVSTYLSYGF